jgi:uracil-DNA glycosylase
MTETDFDFTLDERQRSMLEAMGIKLWLPQPEHAQRVEASTSAHAAQAMTQQAMQQAFQPAPASFSEKKQPLAGIEYAQNAIEKIANVAAPAKPPIPSHAVATGTPRAPRPVGIEQMDWPALQSAVSGCQACNLCESRKTTVFGVGSPPADANQTPQADWLIVGEAPGEQEDIQGEPFVGPAGKLLDNMLAAMKIGAEGASLSRTQGVYIANVLKCRPPANRNPSPEEVAMCEPYLARQIELLRPKIILAMGKFAIQSLTGSNEPVGKLRGRVHTLKHASYSVPVIVTYHPAYLLRNLPDKAKAWADLLLAMQTYRELPSGQ